MHQSRAKKRCGVLRHIGLNYAETFVFEVFWLTAQQTKRFISLSLRW